MRVVFVIGTIVTGGLGLLVYIALLILMPLPGRPVPFAASAPAGGEPVSGAPTTPDDPALTERRRSSIGYFLIVIGALFLIAESGAFRLVRFDFIWPLVLIALGVLLLAQRVRR